MKLKYIYVAGPYSSDPEGNTDAAIADADRLLEAGYIPFIPHLSHFWHERHEHPYEDWLEWCFAWVDRCDAVYRMRGDSPGGNREVRRAREQDKFVFYGHSGLESLIGLADMYNGD